MKTPTLLLSLCLSAPFLSLFGQETLKPSANFVLEHVPPVPVSIAESTARYGESRPAFFLGWAPKGRSMLIATRFGDTFQTHAVSHPGGARTQLTFFREPTSGIYLPDGKSLVISKDTGGNEFKQLYHYDLETGTPTLLTDGQSRNSDPLLAYKSTLLAFASTHRNGKDTDIWTVDTVRPESARLLLQVEGGGWSPVAWSRDAHHLLVVEGISATESHLYLVDPVTGSQRALTPKTAGGPVQYDQALFSADGKNLYVITDRDNEFQRLVRFDLATMTPHPLTASIPWDVVNIDLSHDGKTIALVTNENGASGLYLLDVATERLRPLNRLPAGIITYAFFSPDDQALGFDIDGPHSPSDAYSLDLRTNQSERWTFSETGGLNASRFVEPTLVTWKSFDGRPISGFLYQPDPKRFPGRRPVIVNIHGGPEDQFRPYFLGQSNYLLDQLGVAILYPNVRGSSGYGKSFLDLDNGFHREDTFRDIGALLDWIPSQPSLDPTHLMIEGGSYGGFMTWTAAYLFNDRIRCALPIVGPSNLVTFLEKTESYRRDLRRVEYGDEREPKMRAFLERIAPLNHVAEIRKPIFAVVGKNDPRVPWTESRQIVDKLNAQGTPTWFMMADDEGHGYQKKPNQDFLFNAEVLFIRRYLLDEPTPH